MTLMNASSPVLDRPATDAATDAYDVDAVRADFPILATTVYGKPLVYLDNAASAQKPLAVLDAMDGAYQRYYANVHRGAHRLSQLATDAYEDARVAVARHIRAASGDEIIFTRNATEGFNLVAASFVRPRLSTGDEIIVSAMEHHANIVPWLMLREAAGAVIRVVPIDDRGVLDMDALAGLFGPRTRLVAISHCSNVLGTTNPIAEITALAHAHGVPVVVDGAQGVVHHPVDVQALDADFYIFTGHKLYGPTGIGVVYGKADSLAAMGPWQGGGEMIERVSFEAVTYKEPPHRFEAGTPPIVEAVGLAAAIRYMDALGKSAIVAHEQDLLAAATSALEAIDGLRIHGTAPGKAAIVSFTLDGLHPYDVAAVLDRAGIAVRVGQHCAEPLMQRLRLDGTLRASFALYNTFEEVDALAAGIMRARKMLG